LAIVNLRVSEEMKRMLMELAKATHTSQTELVKNALAERLTVHETAGTQPSTAVPSWVPDGKYVALVRGAVAAVGDSVADVSCAAVVKFPNDPIRVVRKGKHIRPIHYAFLAETTLKCWKYEIVDDESYATIPTTIIGSKKAKAVGSIDTASSLTLVDPQLIDKVGLQRESTETIATAAGSVKMNTFKAIIELPVGRYDAIVAASQIPKALPFQILLGRNILDKLDLYALGKSKVLCLRDP
jgi:predicted aspartyl protease